jgi:TetR/AcrR family transcriptional regulator, fatty acid metabolism regulator protein
MAVEDKRRQILDAAVRVFAEQGYETARVGDIAQEAGVAYGLVYHYFDSKNAVLEAVFGEAWERLLSALGQAERAGGDAAEQLSLAIRIVLRAWRDDPDLVRLLVREVMRSPAIQDELDQIGQAFAIFQRIVEQGQRNGEFRREVDARLAAFFVYGALDEILTGWVLGTLPDDPATQAAAEREVVATCVGGLRSS